MLLEPQLTHWRVSWTVIGFGVMYCSGYVDGGGDTEDGDDNGEEDPDGVEYKSEAGDTDPEDCVALFQYVL